MTGRQLVNPQSYFDLLRYSIKNQSLFKKFEIQRLIDDMCIANSMWMDNSNRDYYALVFEKIPEYLWFDKSELSVRNNRAENSHFTDHFDKTYLLSQICWNFGVG